MKRTLFLSILILYILTCSASNYYVKRIGLENGLSQSSVTSIAYDQKGSLWIGTRFGINEYRNGKLRHIYGNGAGKIKGSYINLLYCDSRKNMWTSTDKGIFRYDPSSDCFVQYDEHPAFCVSESGDSLFWGGNNGISTYNYAEDIFNPGNSEIYTDYIMLDKYDGALLSVDRKDGVKMSYADSTTKLDIPEIDGKLIMCGIRANDILYLSVINLGLVEYSLKERKTLNVLWSGKNGWPSELILTLLVQDNHLWVGFDGAGLRIMDRGNRNIYTIDQVHQSISGDNIPISVTALFKDPLGNIWAGSVRSGLVGFKQSPIRILSSQRGTQATNEDNVIISIYCSDDGNLYVGTDGAGVKKIARYSSRMESYPGHKGLKITSISDYDKQNLIISVYNSGFFLMDRETGRMRPFTLIDAKTNAEECLHSNAPTIYRLHESLFLFLAVNTYIYNKDEGSFLPFYDESREDGKELIVIGSPEKGTLYAFSPLGLFKINFGAHSITQLYKADKEVGRITSAIYHNGIINFGTNYGLFAYDTASGTVSHIDSELFTRVTQLQYGAGGNLWVAADNSLFLFRNGVFEVVGENRGVPANEFLASAVHDNGNIYFGGTSGLVEIDRDYQSDAVENKQIELHDLNVTGKRISIPSGTLRLKHNYSSLMLTVNLAGADPFEKAIYKYTVEGRNGYTSTIMEDNLEIPGLKQGHYKVMVSYMKNNGTWSSKTKVLELRVSPPWYRSIWMIIAYILTGMALIALAIDKLSRKRLAKIEAELKARDLIFTNALMHYINENLEDPNLNVANIASNMAMSRAALYYKVNASFGKGVAELIEERRMEVAEGLLKTTSLSILDVSEKVGYSTPRYFSTRFKQLHRGLTPLKFRSKYRV